MKKYLFYVSLLVLFMVNFSFGNFPESKQATIIDSSSQSEVILESTGIYYSVKKRKRSKRKDIKKYGIENASIDARKSAIYFLLYGGTDPILSTQEEKQNFDSISNGFFRNDNIDKFISYEDMIPIKKILLKQQTGIQVVKRVKVNRELLIQELEKQNIILARAELSDQVGMPIIMVIPKAPEDSTAIEYLKSSKKAQHGAGVIQSFLTARQYDVIIPDQKSFLDDLTAATFSLESIETDPAYKLALSVGSDIYIDYSIADSEGGYQSSKYAVTVRAYETTTARLLGSETGYSKARRGDDFVSIEEAMLGATTAVLNRITNYWKKDINSGIQYKVLFKVDKSFTGERLERVQDAIYDSLNASSVKLKENIVTKSSMDYLIWCDKDEYNTSRLVWRGIRNSFRKYNRDATISLVNQNRKLLLISLKDS